MRRLIAGAVFCWVLSTNIGCSIFEAITRAPDAAFVADMETAQKATGLWAYPLLAQEVAAGRLDPDFAELYSSTLTAMGDRIAEEKAALAAQAGEESN